MKQSRTYLFIAISSVALLMVLIIQVNWILQSAKMKEDLFNEKANLVLARATDALLSDKTTCKKIEACAEKEGHFQLASKLGKDEIHKIDSLFSHYMNFYNFHINYYFEVLTPPVFTFNKGSLRNISDTQQKKGCYQMDLEEMTSKKGFELKLVFPEKKQFIMAEMNTLFITSVVLILIVLFMFWRTVQSLVREKKISEHTTDFLNNMTHEFKTPLTNIALAGKMIIKNSGAGPEDKTMHYTGIILEENEKLKLQVEQVLSMTALERGEIPLQKTELDFHQLIRDSLKYIDLQIENKQGNINLNLNAERFVIMGDKIHLSNALCNLVDNGIKYSKEKPELSIHTFNDAQNLIIVVSDKGIGIEKEYQKKVFNKFFRVPTGNVHDVKGFGLGLAYIKKIVEMHDGTIELQSEKGKGATFTITLPYV